MLRTRSAPNPVGANASTNVNYAVSLLLVHFVILCALLRADFAAFVALTVIGDATNILTGLAVSMQDAVLPVTVIGTGMWIAYSVGDGIYGVALVAAAMLSMAAIVVAVDSYGPITDNVGGIAAVSELAHGMRIITDTPDAVGTTTKAVTTSYAIGSAALAALVLFDDYTSTLSQHGIKFVCQDISCHDDGATPVAR